MKLTDFPVKTRGKFHTQNGKFFRETHEGVWQQIECYLPCAEGTYGEPIVVTAERLLVRLNKGEMKPKRAIGKAARWEPNTPCATVCSRFKICTNGVDG